MEVSILYGIIASREYTPDIKEVIADEQIWFERAGDFNDENFMIHSQAAMNANVQVLFVDMTCANDSAIIRGIKQFRMKRDSRIIMIAPNREPGDPTVNDLISLQVLDFISFTVDEQDEEYERESISFLIRQQLKKKSSYGNVARWNVRTESAIERNQAAPEKPRPEKVKNEQPRGTTEVNDPALMAHLESMLEHEQPVTREREVIITERIVGSVLIAVGGVGRRSGATHNTLQIAHFLKGLSDSVACVELVDAEASPPVFRKLKLDQDKASEVTGGFHQDGVDYYPEASMKVYLQVLSANYDYVVVDLGSLYLKVKNKYMPTLFYEEFFRAGCSVLTCGSAIWEFEDLVVSLDRLYEKGWNRHLSIMVNFSDRESYEKTCNAFTKKEKRTMQVDFIQSYFQPDPFVIETESRKNFEHMFKDMLPTETQKKRIFGGLFRR